MKLNIAALITLIAVVDHSPYPVLATATKTSGYETETISKQEDDDAVSVLPLLRGVKKAVYQFLSDSDTFRYQIKIEVPFGFIIIISSLRHRFASNRCH